MGLKKALITGASSGIGKELASILADAGLELILVARNKLSLQELANQLLQKTSVQIIAADLGEPKGIQTVLTAIGKDVPDLVINNAGIGFYGDLINQDPQDMQAIINLNVSALVALSQQAARTLKDSGRPGVILNIASILSYFTSPGAAVYAASKTYVVSFSKALDCEVALFGIRVLVSCPGQVATNFKALASKGRSLQKKPTGYVLDAKKVAQEIWWQIQKRKQLHVIDWKYRLLLLVTKLLPASLITKRLAATLRAR